MRTHKYLALVLLSLLLGTSARAQKNELASSFSPNLQKFLKEHPENLQTLTSVLSEAFTNRSVRLYYFFSDDPNRLVAEHFYLDYGQVVIALKANQPPTEEFLEIIFEAVNSEGEKRFEELMSQASTGSISRTNFAVEIFRQEFKATVRTRDLIGKLKFTRKEKSKSFYYKGFLEAPDNFEDFIAYVKRVSPKRDWRKDYETKYDILRNGDPNPQNSP